MVSSKEVTQRIADSLRAGGAVCLTGEMEDCDRAECLRVFNSVGLMVSGSVSKRTSFVIAAKDAQQRKVDRANELGIPICTPSEFWDAVYSVFPLNDQQGN